MRLQWGHAPWGMEDGPTRCPLQCSDLRGASREVASVGRSDRMRPEGGSTVVGTFGFMAPEQFQGRASPRSDVYGLGATVLAMQQIDWQARGTAAYWDPEVIQALALTKEQQNKIVSITNESIAKREELFGQAGGGVGPRETGHQCTGRNPVEPEP